MWWRWWPDAGAADVDAIAIRLGVTAVLDHVDLARQQRIHGLLLVSDSEVAPRYLDAVKQTLLAARPELILAEHVLAAGEASKTLAEFGAVIEALAALGATRDACVFALGGGVVGDLAGFAAACWMRGVDCVQLPTSLLAMVDSSVGGKTGVDLPAGKNLVGAFHPPRAVIADTATLHTLPDRELRAGLAEVVKYGALGDAVFFEWLQQHADALALRQADEGAARPLAREDQAAERHAHQLLRAACLTADKLGTGTAGLALGIAGHPQARGVVADLGTDFTFEAGTAVQ